MKTAITRLFAVFILLLNVSAWADQAATAAKADGKNVTVNMLLYIQPVEYTNPIRLSNQFSYAYWFEQGPVVEPLALKKLNQTFGAVSMCDANQSAKVLVWLQPRMFYNPKVQIFYGQVTANVYTGKGELKSTYVGKSKLHGFLDIKPAVWIEKSYAIAIDKMAAKMQADKALKTLIDSNASSTDATLCNMAASLPIPKIRALSF